VDPGIFQTSSKTVVCVCVDSWVISELWGKGSKAVPRSLLVDEEGLMPVVFFLGLSR